MGLRSKIEEETEAEAEQEGEGLGSRKGAGEGFGFTDVWQEERSVAHVLPIEVEPDEVF